MDTKLALVSLMALALGLPVARSAAPASPNPCAVLLSPFLAPDSPHLDAITAFFAQQMELHGKKAVILFAIGGGNDTFSALIPAVHLKSMGYKVHQFGVLSVTAHHYEGPLGQDAEELAFFEPGPGFSRQLLTRPSKQIRNVEHLFGEVAQRLPHAPDSVTLLSSKYPPAAMVPLLEARLRQTLAAAGLEPSQALVVIADFGADVLSRGEASTISPDLDATVFQYAQGLSADFEKVAWLFWPGVDGELSPADLRSHLQRLAPNTIAQATFAEPTSWLLDFERAYFEVVAPLRTGNTIPLAFDLMRQPLNAPAVERQFKKSAVVGDVRLAHQFTGELEPGLVRSSYLIDSTALLQHNPFAQISYHDQLEYFLKIRRTYRECVSGTGVTPPYLPQRGSDFLLQYIRSDKQGLWTSIDPLGESILHILITPDAYTTAQKSELLSEGLNLLKSGQTDLALLDRAQIETAGFTPALENFTRTNGFSFICSRFHCLVAAPQKQGLLNSVLARLRAEE